MKPIVEDSYIVKKSDKLHKLDDILTGDISIDTRKKLLFFEL